MQNANSLFQGRTLVAGPFSSKNRYSAMGTCRKTNISIF